MTQRATQWATDRIIETLPAAFRRWHDGRPLTDGAGQCRVDRHRERFLGRISPDKGIHLAIAVARAAGKRLLIAAKMWQPEEHRYFTDVVQPRLGPDVEYVGEVDAQKKYELLAGAEALINPIGWPEPFGLVMIEALSTGTPVLAFAQGAAPEIIDHGRTGFLCSDEADMVTKLGMVGDLDRAECRRDAEERFSTRRMVTRHVALYRRVLAEAGSARSAIRSPLLVEHRSDGALRETAVAEPAVAFRSANASA